ncbi:nacht and ankyrin domain protein [Colletotrichum sojae]|uniref:Nacht and ankyrin domain protein n=1 Tax=Colletotrichum sojae TaxID=2175907 RepID=A0A8H6IZ07_9PEZI|nr:nacht and ankyrin domain protein [Colletotrichum sojae]
MAPHPEFELVRARDAVVGNHFSGDANVTFNFAGSKGKEGAGARAEPDSRRAKISKNPVNIVTDICTKELCPPRATARFREVQTFDTSRWLTKHDAFTIWLPSPPGSTNAALLMLKAKHGTGKSVLMKEALLRQIPVKPMDEIEKWNGSLPEKRDLAFWTDHELQKTIKKVIGDNSSQDRSFRCRIFTDALDECSNSHQGSSEKAEHAGPLTILHFVANLLRTALEDERYIERQIGELDDPALQLGLLQELIHRSSDGFLWATVVTNQIQEAADWATAKELYDLAEGLPSDFNDTIEKWENSDEGLERGSKFEKRIHRQSRGLIETATLGDSSSLHAGPSQDTEEQVRFIHGSVAPFLRGPRGLGSRHAEPGATEQHAHRLLLECCMRAFGACGLKRDDTVKFLDYAHEFWPVHAREAGDLLDANHSAKLPSFMQKCRSNKWQRVLTQHIRYLEQSQAKEALLIEAESPMLVLLATMGCTTLFQRHLDTCAVCRDACTKYDDKKDVFGSALSNSLIAKRTDTARLLLDVHCNGDVNAPSPDGRTLLYQACYLNHEEIVEFLLKRGADATLPSSRLYEYLLHAAIAKGYTRIIELLLRHLDEEEVEDLLKLPRENSGWTAIHFVMACGRPVSDRKRILNTMLEFAPRGVKLLETRDDNGLTPAELARDG